LIDDTTNWYIRFNRRRLKGEYGTDDTKHALNTLFEVLYTLCRGLAPFTPFITENIYLRILPYIPQKLRAEDDRSIHFLPFPEVREELFDEVVERQVKRMQAVIELGRICRDRANKGLKIPLKTLVVIHPEQEYLDDIKSLENYILEELNIRDLVLSSEEEKYNVQYSVSADFSVLGKKLKKDAIKVKKALPNLKNQEIKDFLKTGDLAVDGIKLEKEDLIVKRGLAKDDGNKNQEFNTDDDVLIILDVASYPELEQEGLAREIIRRVQDLRKKAGLKATDDVGMEYRVLSDPDNVGVEAAFENQSALFEKALRRNVDKHTVTELEGKILEKSDEKVITEEEQELHKATFMLRLVKL
jgi:isoleucyl-tRNA synthetase